MADESSVKQLRLSKTAHQQYKGAIQAYRDALNQQRDQAAKLANYLPVGSLASATDTVTRLISAFHPSDGTTGQDAFLPVLDAIISWTHQFEDHVDTTFSEFQAQDNAV